MDVLEQLRQVLAAEPRLGVPGYAVALSWQRPGALEVSGTLPSLAAKKLALGKAAALPGVGAIVDGLSIRPERVLDDATIREDLRDALLEDDLFRRCILGEVQADGMLLPLLAPEPALGEVTYAVEDGIVTWNGCVADIALKRLASVMAWWVPGVRDVVNVLEAEDDGGDGLAAAVQLVHERDPFLANGRIDVTAEDGVVLLSGQVGTPEERAMAEDDAWAVWDVAEVVNHLVVAR